jgi:hypothetical protein
VNRIARERILVAFCAIVVLAGICRAQTGACCNATGWCSLTTAAQCGGGATFLGLGSLCVGVQCAQPTGACCSSTGACASRTLDQCQSTGDVFMGSGIACGPADVCPVGACCVPMGACSAGLSDRDCTSWNGTFQGAGSTCAAITCPQPVGACCSATTTSCAVIPGSWCELLGAIWQGPSTVCGADSTCDALGLCCQGTTCTSGVHQSTCAPRGHAGAAFIAGAAGVCNADGGTSTPCCYADFNKSGTTNLQDIFDYLNEWFAGNPYCKTGGTPGPLDVTDTFNFLNLWFAGGC